MQWRKIVLKKRKKRRNDENGREKKGRLEVLSEAEPIIKARASCQVLLASNDPTGREEKGKKEEKEKTEVKVNEIVK